MSVSVTLVTNSTRDFRRVPELEIEDWSLSEDATGSANHSRCGSYFRGALGRTRTCDLLIRRPNRVVLCGSLKRAKGDF